MKHAQAWNGPPNMKHAHAQRYRKQAVCPQTTQTWGEKIV